MTEMFVRITHCDYLITCNDYVFMVMETGLKIKKRQKGTEVALGNFTYMLNYIIQK